MLRGCVLTLLWVCVCARADETQDVLGQRARYAVTKNRLLCTKAQSNIDFKELLGLWNVVEVIEHSERYSDRRNYLRAVTRSDSCPVVHFALHDDREIGMLWNDEGGYIQYTFRMTNINNPGFWMSLGFQSGTMLDNNYEHFSGTAQVMKAVQSHMVLTFCSPHERHFSIVLARSKHLSHDEVRGVHKQLNRLNLPLVAVQSYCRNSAASSSTSSFLAALLMTILYIRHTSTQKNENVLFIRTLFKLLVLPIVQEQ